MASAAGAETSAGSPATRIVRPVFGNAPKAKLTYAHGSMGSVLSSSPCR